jgi:hypothetical protein
MSSAYKKEFSNDDLINDYIQEFSVMRLKITTFIDFIDIRVNNLSVIFFYHIFAYKKLWNLYDQFFRRNRLCLQSISIDS